MNPYGPNVPTTSAVPGRFAGLAPIRRYRGAMSAHCRPLVDLAARRLLVSDRVAAGLGLDTERAVRFFEDQIAASKVVQRGLFARWRENPGEAPTSPPDLATIRAELDQLTRQLLARLADVELTPPVSVVDGLDALHREALTTALRSVTA